MQVLLLESAYICQYTVAMLYVIVATTPNNKKNEQYRIFIE